MVRGRSSLLSFKIGELLHIKVSSSPGNHLENMKLLMCRKLYQVESVTSIWHLFELKFLQMGEYLSNFNYISLKFNLFGTKNHNGPRVWKMSTGGDKTSQNFVSAEPYTLHKSDYTDCRLVYRL